MVLVVGHHREWRRDSVPVLGITASGKTVMFQSGKKPLVKSDVITTVSPKYPIDERTNRHQGAGFFRMIIDPKTGLVTNMLVETMTGFDDSVIHAGLQWRWRPATWKEFAFLPSSSGGFVLERNF